MILGEWREILRLRWYFSSRPVGKPKYSHRTPVGVFARFLWTVVRCCSWHATKGHRDIVLKRVVGHSRKDFSMNADELYD